MTLWISEIARSKANGKRPVTIMEIGGANLVLASELRRLLTREDFSIVVIDRRIQMKPSLKPLAQRRSKSLLNQ